MKDIDPFDMPKPKTKLFGERAARVTTAEMNAVFHEVKEIFNYLNVSPRFALSKALPDKKDHGDIDIVVENIPNIDMKQHILNAFSNEFHKYVIEYVVNGPILHCLIMSDVIYKSVHVDFICASNEEYEPTLMYLAYNDFSGILGVIARKLKYNYGNKGFYKIYVDKKGQFHYILLTRNLFDGLRILGYDAVIESYDKIQNIDDIVKFLGSSDLFDSTYLFGSDLNRGDRKRLRIARPTARECREKLAALNKNRSQFDDDFYFKLLFPEEYKKYHIECEKIESFVPQKSKYNGNFIKIHFPELLPGPIYKKIMLMWDEKYGNQLDLVSETDLINFTKEILF